MDMKRITDIDNKVARAVEAVYYFGMYRVSFCIDDSYFVKVERKNESIIELSCHATKSNLGMPNFEPLLTKYLNICENMNDVAVDFIVHEFSSALKACIGKYEQDTAVTTLHDLIERALNRIEKYGDGGYASFALRPYPYYHNLYFHTEKHDIILVDATTDHKLVICSDYKSMLGNAGYRTIFIQLCENQITEYIKKCECTREINMFDGDYK